MLVFPLKKVIVPGDLLPALKREGSFLDRAGMRILAAASNAEALAMHRAEKADLIVAVLDEKGMGAEEMCFLIREDKALRKVSILVVCSESDAEGERCIGCRANAFVPAPINPAVFLQEAHHLLNVAPRKSFRVPVEVTMRISAKEGAHFIGQTENISSSGMLIGTDAVLHEEDTVECTFPLPDSGLITTNATVMRCQPGTGDDPYKYGVAFSEPGMDLVTAIRLYVRKHI